MFALYGADYIVFFFLCHYGLIVCILLVCCTVLIRTTTCVKGIYELLFYKSAAYAVMYLPSAINSMHAYVVCPYWHGGRIA